jgi:hypothetical protein
MAVSSRTVISPMLLLRTFWTEVLSLVSSGFSFDSKIFLIGFKRLFCAFGLFSIWLDGDTGSLPVNGWLNWPWHNF